LIGRKSTHVSPEEDTSFKDSAQGAIETHQSLRTEGYLVALGMRVAATIA